MPISLKFDRNYIIIFGKKLNLGKSKIIINRLRWYIGIIQFLMVIGIFIATTHIDPILVIIAIILLPVITYIDVKIIFPEELEYTFEKNPIIQEMNRKLDKIEKLLEEKK